MLCSNTSFFLELELELLLLSPSKKYGNRLFVRIPAKRVPLARGIMFESKFSLWHNLE